MMEGMQGNVFGRSISYEWPAGAGARISPVPGLLRLAKTG